MAAITSTHPTRPVQPRPGRIYRFFHSGRGDSPFRRLWINALLILACFIAIYPVLRVFSVSLRPNNQLFSTSLDIIPANAIPVWVVLVVFVAVGVVAVVIIVGIRAFRQRNRNKRAKLSLT